MTEIKKPLRRTDKKDKSLFANFSEQDIKNAEIAFAVARINYEFQTEIAKKETKDAS